MSEPRGEKTEQPTTKRLEDAVGKGQIARSSEVQTIFVLSGALLALLFTGHDLWSTLLDASASHLAHLHDTPLTIDSVVGAARHGALVIARCVAPVLVATVAGGLLAGGIQSRFHASPDALSAQWTRLNPVTGFKRIFSVRTLVTTGISALKLAVIMGLAYSVVLQIAHDPIFYSAVDMARIADFMADSAFRILVRVSCALALIAALDYGYQYWHQHRELMMTKEEVRDEMKNTEGNPQVKARRRRRSSQKQLLLEIPKADVIITNPTHLAVALFYDRRVMSAPRVIAKGARLNAARIREIARSAQVPILENKPLARLLFRHSKVGGEIPAELYAAVAEVLAWVYRVNAYRYYRDSQLSAEPPSAGPP